MKKPVANCNSFFISSVQKELAAERRAVKDFITHDPHMAKLVSRAGRQVIRRRFSDTPGLIRKVYASLVECLENRGALRELRQLTDIGIFAKVGGTGQSVHYVIAKANPVIGKRGGNPS